MKKFAKKILIILLLTIMVIGALSINTIREAVSSGVKINAKGDKGGTQYDLTKATSVTLFDRAVYNNNILCAEHGVDLDYNGGGAPYSVSSAYTVQDPVLAYILTNGSNKGQNGFWVSDTQIALWKYLNKRSNKTDADNILGKKGKLPTLNGGENYYSDDYDKGMELYDNAVAYGKEKKEASVQISNFNINYSTYKATFNVSGDYDYFEVFVKEKGRNNYRSVYTKTTSKTVKNIEINVSGYNQPVIKVEASKKFPIVRYRVLKCTSATERSQRLIAITKSSGTNTAVKTSTEDTVPVTDISLQKYVKGIKQPDGSFSLGKDSDNQNVTSLQERSNKYRKSDDTNPKANVALIAPAVGSLDELRVDDTNTKYDSPVIILPGDIVRYQVSVYNNGNADTNVTILDEMTTYTNDDGDDVAYGKCVGYGIVNGSNPTITEIEKNKGEICLKFKFEAKKKTRYYFYIDVKFNREYTKHRMGNTAKIISTGDAANLTEARTVDTDFVRFKQYAVSLNKFVSKVERQNADGTIKSIVPSDIEVRKVNRFNEMKVVDSEPVDASGNRQNRNKYKKENKVGVQGNDIITFTIKLTNTYRRPVKVSEISDKFTWHTSDPYNPYGLEYVENYNGITYGVQGNGARGNGNGYSIQYEDGDARTDTILITFNNPVVLQAEGDEEDINISFKVKLPSDSSITDFACANTATISKIKNGSGIELPEVPDKDGSNNNSDKDWVEIKTGDYQVSLEKYITKVFSKGADGNYVEKDLSTLTSLTTRVGNPIYGARPTEKANKPVNVTAGDKVQFTIKLTNNGGDIIKNVKVEDDPLDIFTYSNHDNVTYNGNENNKDIYVYDSQDGIEPGQSIEFIVEYIVNDVIAENAYNTATILEICSEDGFVVPDGDSDENNTDCDYLSVSGVEYGVALEKYVTEVVDSKGNKRELETITNQYADREGLRDERATTKEVDPVIVNNEYKITYTIKITNTGGKAISNVVIKDISSEELKHNSNNENYFEYTDKIEAGDTVYITKEYTINYTDNAEKVFENEARIISFKDETGTIDLDPAIDDSDEAGEDNNLDQDWVKIPIGDYELTLEKFVYRINEGSTPLVPNDQREGHPIYNKGIFDKEDENNYVVAKKGDKIEYNVTVMNKSSRKVVEKVRVKDTFNKEELEFLGCETLSTWDVESVKDVQGTNQCEIVLLSKTPYNPNMGTKISLVFRVKVNSGKICNTANIESYMDGGYTDDADNSNNRDLDWIKVEGAPVSLKLEKYVTKINNNSIIGMNPPRTTLEDRAGKPRNAVKQSEPVSVQKGETVRYEIKVINEDGSQPAVDLQIKDEFISGQLSYVGCENSKVETNDGGKTFKCKDPINAGEDNALVFWVEYKLETDSVSEIVNTARIDGDQGAGALDSNTDDNYDSDYITPKKEVSVSLEKYVYSVNGSTTLDPNEPREGYPARNGNTHKSNNAVKVEQGNRVRYAIKLINNGTTVINGGVKIKDNFYDDNLIYAGCSGNVSVDESTKNSYYITIDYMGQLPAKSGSVPGTDWIYIDFDVNAAPTTQKTTIENVAEIIEGPEGDLTDDNIDRDWITTEVVTQSQSVKLKKYIVSVSSQGTISGRAGYPAIYESSQKLNDPVTGVGTNDIVRYQIQIFNESSNIIYNPVVNEQPGAGLMLTGYDSYSVDMGPNEVFTYKGTVGANNSVTFWVEYQVTAMSGILTNRAYIPNSYAESIGDTNTGDNYDEDYVAIDEKIYSVSLEKYITKVGIANISSANTNLTNRENNPIYTNQGKINNKVMVEKGDRVTFEIKITNTGTEPIDSIIIEDTPDSGLSYISCSSVNVTRVTEGFKYTGTLSPYDATSGTTAHIVRFTAIFEVSTSLADGQQLKNVASISKLYSGGNEVADLSPNDNTDEDWVQLKKYKVSLEKFISDIDGNPLSLTYNTPLIARGPLVARLAKEIAPVYADVGAKVKFTLIIRNTGYGIEYGNIKKVEIEESPHADLIYSGCDVISNESGNKFVYEASVVSDGIAPGDTNQTLLGFGNNIHIYYEINTDINNLGSKIQNIAKITKIYNPKGQEVTDDDGDSNNIDADYIVTKKYAVSIEKYVTKVYMSDGVTEISPLEPDQQRENHPTYYQNGFSKQNNPVKVEIGDQVIFNVKLKNTGNGYQYGHIKNIKMKDIPNPNSGLEIVDTEIGYLPGTAGEILMTYSGVIELGDTATFTSKFNVKNNGGIGGILENRIEIVSIDNTAASSKTVAENENPNNNNIDSDWVETMKHTIELEKIVVEVDGLSGSNLEPEADRSNRQKHKGDLFKEYNPVLVNKGSKVTYKITIINNPDESVKHEYGKLYKVTIQDAVPVGMEYVEESGSCRTDRGAVSYASGYITWEGELDVLEAANIYLTYYVLENTGSEQGTKIKNEAIVWELYNRNNEKVQDSNQPPEDNNYDEDWVRIRFTAVGIEKFITKVTSKNGQVVEYNNRSDMRYNENYNPDAKTSTTGEDTCFDPYKKENSVPVEPGDVVTFRIRLQNTGELPVMITQVHDIIGNYNDAKLQYNSGPNDIRIVGTATNYINSATMNSGTGIISINWRNPIPPRSVINSGFVDIEIDFEVLSPIRGEVSLNNKVGIKQIKDYYGQEFTWSETELNPNQADFDGPNNNYDMDFVRVLEYKVSLQKVVLSVKDFVTEQVTEYTNRWESWESHANTCGCETGCVDADDNDLCDVCGEVAKYNKVTDYIVNNFVEYGHINQQSPNGPLLAYQKYHNPVMVGRDSVVTYAIKVTNNHNTEVRPTEIIEQLPTEGVELIKVIAPDGETEITATPTSVGKYIYDSTNKLIKILPEGGLLEQGETVTYTVLVRVTEPNLSLRVMKNSAKLVEITNKNNYAETKDVTVADNQDADYIQMKDITISGIVWNDKALDKTTNMYNGKYEYADEDLLEGITVKLYRVGRADPIATTTTDVEGKYTFSREDMLNNMVGPIHSCESYLKASFKCQCTEASHTTALHQANYWAGSHHSYYITFEYDGITYTSTAYTKFGETEDVLETSNAREKANDGDTFDGIVDKSRKKFNDQFAKINAEGAHDSSGNKIELTYDTINESGYIPKSIYNHETTNNPITRMQSSTEIIELSKFEDNPNLDRQIEHINIGLRGRDVFDLELTSDVARVEVKVNDQKGVYLYNKHITLRASDLKYAAEDAANTVDGDVREVDSIKKVSGVEKQVQDIRSTDLQPDVSPVNAGTVTKYEAADGLQGIRVIYRLTVRNASITEGTVTKLTNYFDKKYKFIGVCSELKEPLESATEVTSVNVISDGTTTDYKAVVFDINWGMMKQTDVKELYLVYEIEDIEQLAKDIIDDTTGKGVPTYNMSEITEYKTQCASGQTEATRGLIDKDSAPGSADIEEVRTINNEGYKAPNPTNADRTQGEQTTVEYYFNANNLEALKYEDDTYAAPTVYFKEDIDVANIRRLEGIVFEDKTEIVPGTRIRTGNGKLESGEVGVFGARVQLIELEKDGSTKTRYEVQSDADGRFKIEGYLPGEYIVRYYYGDTKNTVLLNRSSNGINPKSYNGEDFQSTNNKFDIKDEAGNIVKDIEELNTTAKFWYAFNELVGISTATDNSGRRSEVSINVTGFTDEQMQVLNNIRDGMSSPDITFNDGSGDITISVGDIGDLSGSLNIIPNTYMWADTDTMIFTVEKTEVVKDAAGNSTGVIAESINFGKYEIKNMNFGIAEVPVTEVRLEKRVKGFTIREAVGNNVLASCEVEVDAHGNLVPKTAGEVLSMPGFRHDVSIENDELQGAKLHVVYTMKAKIYPEANFDGTSCAVPKITGIADFINNNLVYNPELPITKSDGSTGHNYDYWNVVGFEDLQKAFAYQVYHDGATPPQGNPEILDKKSTTVVAATESNPLIGLVIGEASAEIALEKVLSSEETSIDKILGDIVDNSEYDNVMEVIGFEYVELPPTIDTNAVQKVGQPSSTTDASLIRPSVALPGAQYVPDLNPDPAVEEPAPPTSTLPAGTQIMRDRVRNEDRYIVIPGVQYDYAQSDVIVVHPPTGTTLVNIMYLILAIISLGILALGVFGIKKYVIKNN